MQLSQPKNGAPASDDATGRIGLAMSTLMRAAARAKAHDAATGGAFHSMGVLYVLDESGPIRANLLAEAVHADPSTLSRQVSALTEQGLIRREPDPADGRAALLTITDAGRASLAHGMAARHRHLSGLTADWSEPDRERFAELFERFATAFAGSLSQLTDPSRVTDDSHRGTST
jgi:DNA-binding MarR family transcriptional regulator